jgi:cell division septation protein DedD
VKPEKPGGMNVEGEGGTAFAASTGVEPKGQINPNAVPETPVTQKGPEAAAPPQPQPQPKAAPAPAAAPKGQAPAAPAAPGSTIQLGAFADGATAERVWKGLSGRFTYLAPLSHSVVQAQVNGKTWYRLRASGAAAADVCGRLRVAGENCLRID